MTDGIDSGRGDNPYAAPLSLSAETLPAGDDNSADADLRACIGRNADYYLKKWRGALKGRDQGSGFNWAAFLFSGFWLSYRKMYVATLILFGAAIAESLLEIVLETLIETPAPVWLDRLVTLAFALVCGAFGNRWYLSHCAKVISKSRDEGLTGSDLRQRIANRGGTSAVAALVAFALFLAANFVIFSAVNAFFAQEDVNAEESPLPDDEQ